MSDPRKFKNDIVVEGDIQLPSESASKALQIDGSGKVESSAVTTTELGYVSGVTSAIQTQINSKASATLTNAHILVGNGSNVATDVAVTGDITISNAGVTAIAAGVIVNADINSSAAIDASKIADGSVSSTEFQYLANVTSDIQTQLNARALDSVVIKKDGSVAYTGNQSLGGNSLTNVADPISAQDAATKAYVDAIAQGLKPKQAVRAATLINGTLASAFENGDVIDGVTLATGNRILIKNQTASENNGIYIVQASGAPVRAPDFDSLSPIDEINGAYTFIQEGSQAGQGWVQSGTVTTIGVDPINFVLFNSVASLVGGNGITVAGNDISVDHDGEGLTFAGVQLALELDGSTLSKSASGLKLGNTAVTPGTYGSATQVSVVVVDQQGRLTSASNTTIAIPASQVTDFNEAAQDAVGTILVDSNTIDFTYNDATPSIVADVKTQMSITSDSSGIKLVGDASTPGNLQYYGTNGSGTKGYYALPGQSAGDISETSFSLANNVSSPANVTGLAFAAGVTRSFSALVSVEIDATADLYEQFTLQGINKGGSFNMSVDSVGDGSGVTFSITSAGQVQYTSGNAAGFVSGLIKFRAITTTV